MVIASSAADIEPTLRRTNELRSGVSSATDSVSSFVAGNPLPIALIGVGVGWLIWNARTRPKGGVDYATRGRAEVYDDSYEQTTTAPPMTRTRAAREAS